MTSPPAEPLPTSSEPLPLALPAPTIGIVVLHLDCPEKQPEANVPPRFLYVGLADDGQTIAFTCLGCRIPLGLKQVPLSATEVDLDAAPAHHD